MDNRELDASALQRVCCGNQDALDWIQIGRQYVHAIDDLVDDDLDQGRYFTGDGQVDRQAVIDLSRGCRIRGVDRVCRIGALALRLYGHPFFTKHSQALTAVMLLNTVNYRDSVRFEESAVEWQRNYSDWARHGWLDVCRVVAMICGGYENAANESMEMIAVAYANHHDGEGKPT